MRIDEKEQGGYVLNLSRSEALRPIKSLATALDEETPSFTESVVKRSTKNFDYSSYIDFNIRMEKP